MKKSLLLLTFILLVYVGHAQEEIQDNAIIHQQQRMVFMQWDQNKFDPKAGFLSLNPYYWLVWGWFDPNYHKTDLRPLSATGPQTQRLGFVGVLNTTDHNYKPHSDTVRNTALSQIAATSGLLSDADPLWLLYYRQQFGPLLNYSALSLLGPLSPQVSSKLVSEGMYSWYTNELSMLKERLQGARTTDMDRGSRIIAYYRLLQEYNRLAGVWNIRVATAAKDIQMTTQNLQLRAASWAPAGWTPQTDVQIANSVLLHAIY